MRATRASGGYRPLPLSSRSLHFGYWCSVGQAWATDPSPDCTLSICPYVPITLIRGCEPSSPSLLTGPSLYSTPAYLPCTLLYIYLGVSILNVSCCPAKGDCEEVDVLPTSQTMYHVFSCTSHCKRMVIVRLYTETKRKYLVAFRLGHPAHGKLFKHKSKIRNNKSK